MPHAASSSPRWQRVLWIVAGALAMLLGVVGIVLPVMPTVPFVLLAAFCFSRGSERCERWILEHRHFGPPVRAWREHRAVPLRAKQFATVMMAGGAAFAAWLLPAPWGWAPAGVCSVLAIWLWRLPTMGAREAAALKAAQRAEREGDAAGPGSVAGSALAEGGVAGAEAPPSAPAPAASPRSSKNGSSGSA